MAVVPHTPAAGLKVLAERVRTGVHAVKFESDGKRVPITVSVGGATMADGQTLFFDQLVSAAEAALDEAAAAGGDRFASRDPGLG